jgi:hypothetical protein
MDITGHVTFLPHDDPDASLALRRDLPGLRDDAGHGRAFRYPAGGLVRVREPH